MTCSKIKIIQLAQIDYSSSEQIQYKEKENVKQGLSQGTIYILEHNPPIITIGRHFGIDDILLNNHDIEIKKTSRGGSTTAHEPGQVVIYFVLSIKSKNTAEFVNACVKPLILLLSEKYSLLLEYNPKKPGLWVKDKKIASVGFDLTDDISMHGIAINISNDLNTFKYINPCGFESTVMTSLSKTLNKQIDSENFSKECETYYSKYFS